MKNIKTALQRAGLLGVLASLGACSQMPYQQGVNCGLDSTSNVDRLFAQVSEKLRDSSCHYSFDDYRARLVTATRGAPEAENEQRFAGLLRTSIDQGIISRRQGQQMFSRYFDPEFYSVKSEPRSSCSTLRRQHELQAAMREELADKRVGMLEILDDEDRFRQAQRHYSDLNLVFDAVGVACSEQV